jgi:hypothetical protein
MISRSVENRSRLSIRLPLMIRDRVAGEAVPACFPASLMLSPELAGIRSLHPEIVGDGYSYRLVDAQSNRCNLQSI